MERKSSFQRELELEEQKFDLQNLISAFFEGSTLNQRLLKFETLNNELDWVRMNLFQIKEEIQVTNDIMNPKPVSPPKSPIKGRGSTIVKSKIGAVKIINKSSSVDKQNKMNKSTITTTTRTQATPQTKSAVPATTKSQNKRGSVDLSSIKGAKSAIVK